MADNTAEDAFLKSMAGDDASIAITVSTPDQPNSTPSQTQTTQPRIVGGFLVDDDDEDDGGPAMPAMKVPAANGLSNIDRGLSSTPQRSLIQSPAAPASPKSDVARQVVAQDQVDSLPVTNNATNLVTPPEPSAALQRPSTATPTIATTATPQPSQTLAAKPLPEPIAVAKARLPNDRIGILEDRIRDDPRGDMEAWLSLISEHRKRSRFADARATYERFFKVFPSAAEQWIAYIKMEDENHESARVANILSQCLVQIPHLDLWSTYLNHIRRLHPLTTDFNGANRKTLAETYEFVLQNVGIDKDSGQLWQDYVDFIRSGPGQIGGSNWQDQQKMDVLRKTYQRAICIPSSAVNALWKDYDQFEMGLNKMTGRKFLQERSPAYVTARSSYTALQNLTRGLNRTTMPSLPPLPGFDGDVEYAHQVELWKRWIQWEKDDPLELKDDDLVGYKARVLLVYKQALMALRFWPEMWYEAADFCLKNGLEVEGNDFLTQGMTANPESCLLAFKKADQIESTTTNDDTSDSIRRRGNAVREPYDKALDALYGLIALIKSREVQTIARMQENFEKVEPKSPTGSRDDDEEDAAETIEQSNEALQKMQIEMLQKGNATRVKVLAKTISFVWIALMRAMRRIQGKGKKSEDIGGSREVFTEARRRGRVTSDVYVASALIEYHCYKDVAATKIFERGIKLFPEDEHFAVEYLKHLIAINDTTNARAVFETTVNKLISTPDGLVRSKSLFAFFHDYESSYGELSQITKLEHRMAGLFPEDPQLVLFSKRYSSPTFDPIAVRPVISPFQAKPKLLLPLPQAAPSVTDSPVPAPAQLLGAYNSPKRPLEESDNESLPPRKMVRGESPLKGAAGRRLDAQKRTQLRNEVRAPGGLPAPPPPTLAREILFLLSIIPHASKYDSVVMKPEAIVELLRTTDLGRASDVRQPAQGQNMAPMPVQASQYGYPSGNGYGR